MAVELAVEKVAMRVVLSEFVLVGPMVALLADLMAGLWEYAKAVMMVDE